MQATRFAIIAASIGLSLAACEPEPNASADQTSANRAAVTETGDKVGVGITGAGATFIHPLMSKWSSDYHRATSAKVNYQSIGSSDGITQIEAAAADFGSSDKPLSSEELAAAGLVQFPLVIGGVVPVVNLDGVDPGKIRLTPTLLADIFLGRIAGWNDPELVAANPNLKLPATRINLVHRSDGSGTTFNFTHYLSQVSQDWREKVGEGVSVKWPAGIGGKGNEGVAFYVRQIKGSISYVELAYALQNGMTHVSLRNAAGNWVQPSAKSFAAAAASADWNSARDFNLVLTNAPGTGAWPIAATNFILMNKQTKDATRNENTLEFFKWAFANGGKQAEALGYVPLPPKLVRRVEAHWRDEFK